MIIKTTDLLDLLAKAGELDLSIFVREDMVLDARAILDVADELENVL